MRLRFVEDRRSLLWAFLLFPLGPALAFWRPSLLPWLTPLLVYCSYLSGVLSHNHNHCPVFRARGPNLGYGAWLSIFYGFPSFAWIPTHNQNHHRYANAEGDVTTTARHTTSDSLLAALSYPLASARWQMPIVVGYARQAFVRRSAQRARIALESAALVGAHASAWFLAVALHGTHAGSVVYLLALGLPALSGTYWMMLTNYLQHIGCEPNSQHSHSRNFVSPGWNWLVFDNGYHTVHHEHPGLHWSRYRALHHLASSRIPQALNESTIVGYALRSYLRGPTAPATR
jgi:fatty acid desaturase